MLRSIAKSGLKGRPRQTRILLVALGLAFLFVTLSFILLSTSNSNRLKKRQDTFGEWQAVHINQSAEDISQKQATYDASALIQLIGRDDKIGLVGSADSDFWDMAHIKVIEGRLPEEPFEVVIGQSQLSYFAESPQVGDTITGAIKTKFREDHGDEVDVNQFHVAEIVANRFKKEFVKHWDKREQFIDAIEETAIDNLEFNFQFVEIQVPEGEDEDTVRERIFAEEEIRIQQYYDRWREILNRPAETEAEKMALLDEFDYDYYESYIQSYFQTEEMIANYIKLFQVESAEALETYLREWHSQLKAFHEAAGRLSFVRNSGELEGIDGVNLQSRIKYSGIETNTISGDLTRVVELLPKSLWPDLSDIEHFVMYQEVVFIKDLTIVGIIEDYQVRWDGPVNQYPTAFVTQETAHHLNQVLAQSIVPENRDHAIPHLLFVLDDITPLGELPDDYFVNQLARDDAAGVSENLVSQSLLWVFSLLTGFSIFQISLVQLKKRQRKFALLRSIGATQSQIKRIMSWEAFYLLILALPIGTALGLGLSWLLIYLNNLVTGDNIQFVINPIILAAGLALTLLASLVGLFLPLRRLENIPMIGNVQVINRMVTMKTREIVGEKQISRQSLQSINHRHHRFIRKQRLINLGLYSLILFIILGSLWLIYLSFSEYRTQVLDTGMPDFEFVRGTQQSNTKNRAMTEELQQLTGVTGVDIFARGDKSFLYYDGIAENELHNYFLAMIPGALKYDYYGTQKDHVLSERDKYLTKEAMVIDVYGYDTTTEYGQSLKSVLPEDFNWQSFHEGKTVILLSPSYELFKNPVEIAIAQAQRSPRASRMKELFQQTKSAIVSYDYRRTASLRQEPTFEHLEQLKLTIPTGETRSIGLDDEIPTNEVLSYDLQLGAVLHALPSEGLWPLSYTIQNPVILVSKSRLEELYPYTFHAKLQNSMISIGQRAERYGSSMALVHLPHPTDAQSLEVKRIGHDYDFTVNSWHLVKSRIYAKGFQTSLIVGFLGVALLVIALQIQVTSARGMLETERNRIGILQSLGVGTKDYRQSYLWDALKQVVLAAVLTHIVLLLVIGLYLLISRPGADLLLELKISLSDYPYLIHGLIVLLFLLLGTLAAYIPLGNILKRQPVENIRSLN